MSLVADRILPDEIERRLTTEWLGRTLHYYDEVGSTNDVARELARAGAVEGTVVIAEGQTRGRGRLGRSWASPKYRNLYLSALLRPPASDAPVARLGLVAGVAVCDAIRESHPATIKWPNDVLIGTRKVSGVLAEIEPDGAIILGIGVNLNTAAADFPADLRDKAGSLFIAGGVPVDRTLFTVRLLIHLEARYVQERRLGFAPIAEAWCEMSAMIGKTIRVDAPGGQVQGVVLGLADDGALRLRLPSGVEHRVVSGDVSVVGGYD